MTSGSVGRIKRLAVRLPPEHVASALPADGNLEALKTLPQKARFLGALTVDKNILRQYIADEYAWHVPCEPSCFKIPKPSVDKVLQQEEDTSYEDLLELAVNYWANGFSSVKAKHLTKEAWDQLKSTQKGSCWCPVTRAAGRAMAAKLPEIYNDVHALSDPLNSIDLYEGPLHWLKATDSTSLQKYFQLCLPQTSTMFWQQDRNACISSIVKVWNVRDADETDWQAEADLVQRKAIARFQTLRKAYWKEHTEAEAQKLLSSLDEAAMLRLQPTPYKQWILPFRKARAGAVEKILLTFTMPEGLLSSLKREDFTKYLQMHDLRARNMPKAVCVQTILTAWQDAACEDQKQIWTAAWEVALARAQDRQKAAGKMKRQLEAKQWKPVSRNGAAMFLLNTTPKVFEKLAQHFLGKDGLVAHALATSKDTSKRSAAATEIVQKAASPYALVNNSIFSAEVIKRTRKACGYLDAEDDSNEGAEDDSLEDADDELGQLSPKLVQQCLVLSRWEQDISGCDDDNGNDDVDSRSAMPDVPAASITNSSSNNSKVQAESASGKQTKKAKLPKALSSAEQPHVQKAKKIKLHETPSTDGASAASQSSSASAMANEDSEVVEGGEEPLSVPDTSEVSEENICQAVVDEAHLLCWQHSIKSERRGQEALMKQLRKKGFRVRDEVHIATFILDDMEMTNRVDLLINDKVIVECKHVSKLKAENQQQLRDYMDLPKLRKNHGVLISFPKNCDPVTLPAEIGRRGPGFQAGTSRVHFEEIAVSASVFNQRAAARRHRG